MRAAERSGRKPRVGCLGVGWIGCNRMQAVVESGAAHVVALADPSPEALRAAAEVAPGAVCVAGYEELLALDLDGVILATPSALHAEQSLAALERGLAVFCQKPLARTAAETRAVLDAARAADRLLGVDFSYRHVAGVPELRGLIQAGELGRLFAVDLVFHNAYGPDKDWFYDAARSGGGCLIDLGIHLVDLALWALDFPELRGVDRACYAKGVPLNGSGPGGDGAVCEDYATARLEVPGGPAVRVTCSWRLHAGQDAVIEANFFGTGGGASLRNVDGSFYDFVVERYRGTDREVLARPPDAWGGRAAVDWAERLAASSVYDPAVEGALRVAEAIDWIYGRA